ncbi:MAG: methyltransferase [Rhodocyclaceae bacterium]|nr:methyltransferase [Rhodocyclaceae bacterium]
MELYLFDEMAQVARSHWWFAARREILAALIARLDLPRLARIVEIGCGTGDNLAMLSRFGQVRALEAEPYALAIARQAGVEVLPGRLGEVLPLPEGIFDLVCLFDVLEHVADDGRGLAAAARLLRPSGRLVATVPAYPWLFGPHDVAHHHFRRYSAGSLRRVAEAAGLKVERLGYFNTLLFPLIAAGRLADRLLGREVAHAPALPPEWLNRVLHAIFAAEAPLVARTFLPFGTSVIAVLKPDNGGWA